MASVPRVKIDGTDVTNVCIAGAWTPRLNRPAQCTVTIPMDAAIGDVGSRLKLEIDNGGGYVICFHGFILNTETDTNKDGGTTVYNAMDPMELWQWRPVRADDGDFSLPAGTGVADGTDLFATYVTGSLMMEAVLKNSEGDSTAQGNGALAVPDDAEGTTFLHFGAFAGGGADLTGAPVDWPMTIAEFFSLLCSTGEVDLYITPTDPGGGEMGTITGYNGRYGTDRSGSILFSYGMGAHNVDSLRWNRDMTNMVNKYYIFAGPRMSTAADPKAAQHFCFNVQGDDPDLCGNSGTPTCIVNGANVHGIGGALPTRPSYDAPGLLGNKLDGSRTTYGTRMKMDIYDAADDTCNSNLSANQRAFYRRQWQEFSWFSSAPREIIHVTPTRDTEIGTFGIGDIVGVEATTDVRGGFSGAQRVYEYTISWDQDSVLTLSELQTSSDSDTGR